MIPEPPLPLGSKHSLTHPAGSQGIRWLTPACLVLGTVGAFLIWRARPVHRTSTKYRYEHASHYPPTMAPLMMQRNLPDMRDSMFPHIQPRPLYVANLASETGPYTVSVRQVIAGEYRSTLHTNVNQSLRMPALNAFRLSMQIMTSQAAALDHVLAFTTRCSGVDDRGNRLEFSPLRSSTRFPGGIGALVTVSGFSPEARGIKRLKGEILISDKPITANERSFHPDYPLKYSGEHPFNRQSPGDNTEVVDETLVTRSLPFELENVPLPNATHVFGLAAAAQVTSRTLLKWKLCDSEPLTSPKILSEGLERPLLSLFPPYTPPAGSLKQPVRLILPLGMPATFAVPLSDKRTLTCHMTCGLNAGGRIPIHLTIKNSGPKERDVVHVVERDIVAWDNVPQVLLLPAGGETIALFLNLYLDLPPISENPVNQATFPFMAPPGKQGGAIVGQTSVSPIPLSFGVMDMEVHDEATAATAVMKVSLDQNGNYRFANVKPGRYTLRLIAANAYFSQITPGLSLVEYAQQRWHLRDPQWNATLQTIEVRAGGISRAKPWTLQERSTALAASGSGVVISGKGDAIH